jgi:hypothetical protein
MNEACWRGYKQIGMKKKGGRTVPNCVKEHYRSFAEWLNESDEGEGFSKNYVKSFASLPWDWEAMQRDKIVQPLFFYSPEQSDVMEDWQDSIITLFNLLVEKIPRNQLSAVNRHTGNRPDQGLFLRNLRREDTWYDKKIDQIYWSIEKLGKRPEDYGGRDVRPEIDLVRSKY